VQTNPELDQAKTMDSELITEASAPSTNPIQTQPTPETTRPTATQPRVSPLLALRRLVKGETDVISTNALALGLVTTVVGIFAVVVAGQAIVSALLPTESTTVTMTPQPTLPNTVVSTHALPAVTGETLRTTLDATASLVGTAEEEIVFTDPAGELLSAQEISTLMGLRLNPNLRQSLTAVRLVVIDTIQHGLVFEVTDTFTALGGMLEWEAVMQDDLDPVLFLADLPPASLSYIDATFNEIDLRVLTDGTEDVLVYGFVDEDTILITKRRDTFERLAR
jgi:hypothetical protein